jgi:hypothetical protein
VYLSIYLIKYLFTYLWQKLKSNVVIYMNKKIHSSSNKHVKSICNHIFYKVVWWFNGQSIGVEPRRLRLNSPYQYILCEICVFWGVTLYYFPKVCMFECIPHQTLKKFHTILHIVLEYNIGKILKIYSSFHFIKWEIGIYLWKRMYLCIQKHKYIPNNFEPC